MGSELGGDLLWLLVLTDVRRAVRQEVAEVARRAGALVARAARASSTATRPHLTIRVLPRAADGTAQRLDRGAVAVSHGRSRRAARGLAPIRRLPGDRARPDEIPVVVLTVPGRVMLAVVTGLIAGRVTMAADVRLSSAVGRAGWMALSGHGGPGRMGRVRVPSGQAAVHMRLDHVLADLGLTVLIPIVRALTVRAAMVLAAIVLAVTELVTIVLAETGPVRIGLGRSGPGARDLGPTGRGLTQTKSVRAKAPHPKATLTSSGGNGMRRNST